MDRCVQGFRKLKEIIPYLREARERFARPGSLHHTHKTRLATLGVPVRHHGRSRDARVEAHCDLQANQEGGLT